VITVGIDIGSRTTKAVMLNQTQVLCRRLEWTTWARTDQAKKLFDKLIVDSKLKRSQVTAVWVTGYGRVSAPFADGQATEITCHAKGAHFLDSTIGTVIDVGGQDSKVIRLERSGRISDFRMNDRCAAGTGKFLEALSQSLGLGLDEFVQHGLRARQAAKISNMCTVFAESEAIGLLAAGIPLEEVVLGLHRSIAGRLYDIVQTVGVEPGVAFTGGGAKNAALHRELEALLAQPIRVMENPEYTGALGAALLARERKMADRI